MKNRGYYLPRCDEMFGDNALAQEAKAIWESLGLDRRYAYEHDGVDVEELEDGTVCKAVILRDFFSEDFKFVVKEYPFSKDT
jgi:hypothetical protein